MLKDYEPEPLLIKHAQAMRMIGYGQSHYWRLVKRGKITAVEKGRASRAYLPSIRAYVQQMLSDAQAARKDRGEVAAE